MLNDLLSKLNTKYVKDIFTAFTGTSISQIIPILAAPILSRIYTPSDYGLLGIYMSITAILFVFVTFQYSQSIILTKTKEEEINTLALCLIFILSFTFLTATLLIIFNFFQFNFFTQAKLGFWLYFIPFSIFLNGVNTILTKLLNKYQKYKALSFSQISSSVSITVFSLFFGFILKSHEGLFIGFLIGQLSKFILLIINIKDIHFHYQSITTLALKKVLIRYKKFPIYSIPTEFLFGWTDQMPIYFFNSFFNTAVVGNFNYGKRMVSLPISFITSSVGNVFAQKAAEEVNKNGECKKLFISTLKMLALPILPIFIILAIFAPFIFSFVFGNKWTSAGEYVQILIPMFYLKAIVSPLSYMFIIRHKQNEDLILHIISFLFVAFSFYISYIFSYNIKTTLSLFSFSYCLIYIIYFCKSYLFSLKQ